MREVRVRRGASITDLEGMIKVELEAWPEEQAFTREHFESHLEVFPEGIFIAEVDGAVAGVGISEIIQYDAGHPVTTWYAVTDNGYLRRSHNPCGNVLYGVSLSASPRFSTARVGEKMLDLAKSFVVERHLGRFVIGSRIPRYHKWSDRMSVEEYVFSKRGKKGEHFLDPEIEFYSRCGFRIVRVLPDYFEDPDSLNFGVLMTWDNPSIP